MTVTNIHIWQLYLFFHIYDPLYSSWDSSVGRAADLHARGPGFNTH